MNKIRKLLEMEFDLRCKCREPGCELDAKKYWNEHKTTYCNFCSFGLHSNCGFEDIANVFFIFDAFQVTDRLLDTLNREGKRYRMNKRFPGYDEQLRFLESEFSKLLDQFAQGLKYKNIVGLMDSQKSIINLKDKIDASEVKMQLSSFIFNQNLVLPLRGSTIEFDTSKDADKLLSDAYERMAQQITKIKDKEVEEQRKAISKEWNEKADGEIKKIIQKSNHMKEQLEGEVEELKTINWDLKNDIIKWSETIDRLKEEIGLKDEEMKRVDNQPVFLDILCHAYNSHFKIK